jgi:hypothetical protein
VLYWLVQGKASSGHHNLHQEKCSSNRHELRDLPYEVNTDVIDVLDRQNPSGVTDIKINGPDGTIITATVQ